MMNHTKLALAAAVLLCCASPVSIFAAPAKTNTPSLDVLARVNNEPVTSKQLLDLFTDRHSGHAKFLGGDGEARSFLNIVIDDRLLVQEAYDVGLDQDPTVVGLVDDFATKKAVASLIKSEIDGKARPTPDEVKATWKSELNYFLHVRQIAVATREEAEELRRALVSGADFDMLARWCSLAESRLNGGHIMASWGQFEPEWERIVFALQPGEISPIIETLDGFEIVLVDNRFDGVDLPPFDKVSSDIESVLSKRKLEARRMAFSNELFAKYHVVLQPVPGDVMSLLKALGTAPDTVVATWDGGGKLALKECFSADELRQLMPYTPLRAKNEIASRIRVTINEPLVTLEAKARKIADEPGIADETAKYREYIMESVLFRDHIFKDIAASDDEARAYYDAHKSEFEDAEQRRVAQILVKSEADAKSVRAQIVGGTSFEDAAKKFSKDFASALSGGELGWITPDKVPAGFKDVLTLKVGEVSQPLKSENGWHLIKVLEIKPKQQQAFDAVKEKAREKALDVKKQVARKFWVDKLRAASKIEINDAAIKKFVEENQLKSLEAPGVQHQIPASELAGPHS